MYRLFAKRLIDIVLSAAGLIIFSPVIAIVSILILVESGWPIIYFNQRVTVGGRIFRMAKFRSMYTEYSTGGKFSGLKDEEFVRKVLRKAHIIKYFEKYKKIPNDPRVTRVGRAIRALSIDEVPQFLNVLFGDMSIVGPRAYKDYEVAEKSSKSPEFKKLFSEILSVRPGITGPWQIGGRSKITFDNRIKMEAKYAKNLSFLYDLTIMAQTPFKVIQREGAS